MAYDGDSSHSPFATALLDHIDTPDTPIQNVMTSVTRDVYLATKERQRPWVNASLISEVYLNREGGARTDSFRLQRPSPEISRLNRRRLRRWGKDPMTPRSPGSVRGRCSKSAQRSGAAEDYQAYLAAYPQGQFAGVAQNFITRAANNTAPVGNAGQAGSIALTGNAATEPTMTVATLPQADMTGTSGGSPELVAPPAAIPPPATGTSLGEAALGWDQSQRREVQLRLELTGREVGRIDGKFRSAHAGCGQRLAACERARRHRLLHRRAIPDARCPNRGSIQATNRGLAKADAGASRVWPEHGRRLPPAQRRRRAARPPRRSRPQPTRHNPSAARTRRNPSAARTRRIRAPHEPGDPSSRPIRPSGGARCSGRPGIWVRPRRHDLLGRSLPDIGPPDHQWDLLLLSEAEPIRLKR